MRTAMIGLLWVAVLCGVAAGDAGERFGAIGDALRDEVDRGRLAGGAALVVHGDHVYREVAGWRDAEAAKPMTPDTIFRIASMTKPITSVAVMILYEEGRFDLDDPVSDLIPAFGAATVIERGEEGAWREVQAARPITIHHLLTHTSGITYTFMGREGVAERYAAAEITDGLAEADVTLAEGVDRLAALPLVGHPGEVWEYGLSTDVLGRVVEAASGMSFEEFCRQRIFEPLGMVDTHFYPPAEKLDRLAALYAPGEDGRAERVGDGPQRAGSLVYSASSHHDGPRKYLSGGAGLVSTIGDYARFLRMLLNGGSLDGARVLSPESVATMTSNRIGDLPMSIGSHGDRFGYGFGVWTEDGAADDPASPGAYSWGGLYSTYFFVDPERELIGVLMTQLFPSGHITLRDDFRRLAYEGAAATVEVD